MSVPLPRPWQFVALGVLAVVGVAGLWWRGGSRTWSERSLLAIEQAIEAGHVGNCLAALDPDYPYLRLWPALADLDLSSAKSAAPGAADEPPGKAAARTVLMALFAANLNSKRDLSWELRDLRLRDDGDAELRLSAALSMPDSPGLAIARRELSLRLRFHGWLWPRGLIIDHDPIRGGGYG